MKKILSVVLAMVMMLAICVPAFAEKTITDKTGNSATTLVKTDTNKENGDPGENYKVIIPSDTTIPWGKDSIDLLYSVEAHLGYGKKISVSVEGNYTMALKEDENEKLAYTLGGATSYVSATPVVNPAAAQTFSLAISDDAWANAIVGEYSDTLTFTAEIL